MTDVEFYFLIAVTSAVAFPVLVFSLIRGKNPARKWLRLTLLLLSGMVLLRFGGEYVLSKLGMGWRCSPRYTMNFLIWLLGMVSVVLCLCAFKPPQEKSLISSSLVWMCSIFSMLMSAAFVTLLMFVLSLDRLNESVITINGQSVVKESKMNGGVVRRFYLPVNFLVHGEELEYDWQTGLVQMPTGEKANPYNS